MTNRPAQKKSLPIVFWPHPNPATREDEPHDESSVLATKWHPLAVAAWPCTVCEWNENPPTHSFTRCRTTLNITYFDVCTLSAHFHPLWILFSRGSSFRADGVFFRVCLPWQNTIVQRVCLSFGTSSALHDGINIYQSSIGNSVGNVLSSISLEAVGAVEEMWKNCEKNSKYVLDFILIY